ncbi:MAG: AAA family ATPase, partial [Planctomycetota bacterium]
MHIEFVEIQNFRKLRSCRVELSEKTTVFVGANNSGKTSAMDALILFLLEKKRFTTTDFTLSNWIEINKIGDSWVKNDSENASPDLSIETWQKYLPCIDVWIKTENNEIHYVSKIIPTLGWTGGLLGIRLRLEPENIEELYKDYLSSFKSAKETIKAAKNQKGNKKSKLELWPRTMREFLDKRLRNLFTVRSYILDPTKSISPKKGIAQPQELYTDTPPLIEDPFKGLIKIDKIDAQRGFSDPNISSNDVQYQHEHGLLSAQFRSYFDKHLDPSELPDVSDIDALEAIENAQSLFDENLHKGFEAALIEL